MTKKIDLTEKYSRELTNINHKLKQLENGKVYELTKLKQDGYLATNIEQLRRMLNDLLYKIEIDDEGDSARLRKEFDKYIK